MSRRRTDSNNGRKYHHHKCGEQTNSVTYLIFKKRCCHRVRSNTMDVTAGWRYTNTDKVGAHTHSRSLYLHDSILNFCANSQPTYIIVVAHPPPPMNPLRNVNTSADRTSSMEMKIRNAHLIKRTTYDFTVSILQPRQTSFSYLDKHD